MSGSARVESLDAIKDFRVYLAKFQELASRALGDADSDVHRTVRWLEGEGLNYWTSTIRKRQEALQKAEEALRFKRLYKDASGSTPSAVEEQKQVKICKDRLQSAQEKLSNVKRWSKALQKEITLYRGGVSRFANDVSAGVPAMVSHLGALLDHLDQYIGITADVGGGAEAGGVGAGAAHDASDASMARAADERPSAEEEKLDGATLRGGIPSAQAIIAAKPVEAGRVEMTCGTVSEEQMGQVAKYLGAEVANDQRVAISPAIFRAGRIYVARIDTAGIAWFIGAVNASDSGVYNTIRTGDLKEGRPDIAELLRLPVGYIAVVGSNGVEAVFGADNQNVLQAL